MRVAKKSLNPFKSGNIINTVNGTVINPHDPKKRKAYTFEEDDSFVNIETCFVINSKVEEAIIKDLKVKYARNICQYFATACVPDDIEKVEEQFKNAVKNAKVTLL